MTVIRYYSFVLHQLFEFRMNINCLTKAIGHSFYMQNKYTVKYAESIFYSILCFFSPTLTLAHCSLTTNMRLELRNSNALVFSFTRHTK